MQNRMTRRLPEGYAPPARRISLPAFGRLAQHGLLT